MFDILPGRRAGTLSLVCALAWTAPVTALAAEAESAPQDVSSSEIIVMGQKGEDYKVGQLTTATRTGTDIMDVPQSIQFVPRDVIDDQQILDLTSALRNVSGIQAGTNAGNRSESFTIRGFRSSYYAVDSIMLSPAIETNDSYRDMANIERIEVLKGPASVLYGRGDPGGLINIVTKQPKFERAMNFSVQAGSNDFARGQIDVTGPIDAAKTLAFRVVGAAQTGDTFRDIFQPFRRQFLSGSLLWQPDEKTRVIASLTYAHQQSQSDRGLVATIDADGDLVVNLPRDRFLGEKWATLESERYEFNYRIEHELTDWLTIRQIGHYDEGKLDLFGINNGNSVTVNATTGARTMTRTAVEQHENNHNYDFQADMVARFNTLGIGHTVVFGGEYVKSYRFRTFARATLSRIDIDNPVYGAQPGTFVPAADRLVRAKSWSGYVQDQIDIGDHFNLLAGVRFDHAQQSDFGTTQYASDDKAWSPRFGIVWKPVENVSLFADYTKSFQSKPEPTIDGKPIDPEKGRQYEAGIKAELFDGRLGATVAVYDLLRENVTQQDPNNVGFNINAGVQRSRGVEVDLSGSITPAIKLIANGAYTDATVRESTDYAVGNQLIGVPKWSGSIWVTWEPTEGALRNFGFGGGIFAASDRQGDLENSFSIGGYTRLDSSLWYKIADKLRVSINVKNIANDYYMESAVSRAQITPGEGRSFLIGLSGSF
jgi:iron complex outermembrane receptor protein|eukprot:TRINITY_DN9098_c0_g1_i3.p1 TRINITY_DN9098_c0_g1~~TRINITY_DN9098_c0_g1_i3.p1  ORF type:complete len:711 (+),score=188.93 TRINITY_DN9098_c0_g1_i3:559-2691(+)